MTNQTPKVGLIGTGDMGHAVGGALKDHGLDVVTSLVGRSARSRGLAQAAGIHDLGSLDAVAGTADLVLSILPPDAALPAAEDMADALARSGGRPVYVDCNAVSPDRAQAIADRITAAGAVAIDVGIIGGAPGRGAPPRFYASGPEAGRLEVLDGKGIDVAVIGDAIGRASGLKMCYAALTKGRMTLHTAVLIAAEVLGLSRDLRDELSYSQAESWAQMQRTVPRLPADAGRWVGEMEEIAATFRAAGVTPGFHDGAAEIFRLLAQSPYAAETRETIDPNRTVADAVPVFAALLAQGGGEAED